MTTKVIKNVPHQIILDELYDTKNNLRIILTKREIWTPIYFTWFVINGECHYPHMFEDINKAKADYHNRLLQAYHRTYKF